MGISRELALLVLAAGRGTRMRSRLPKVLHPVCGRPLLLHPLALGDALGVQRRIVVVSPGQDEVQERVAGHGVEIVEQAEPLGTGHAVLQARPLLNDHPGSVLILYGDHPLYRARTLEALLEVHASRKADLTLLTGQLPDPSGYGRIVRGSDGRIDRIVEDADAPEEIRALHEVNLGVYVAAPGFVFATLEGLERSNAQGELYLTDLVELALRAGRRVETHGIGDWTEAIGVNDRVDLARAESVLRRRIAERWMLAGVSFVDPERTYVDVDVEIGPDSVIEPGVRLRGQTRIGAACRIDAGVVVDGCRIGDGVWIKPHCWLEGSRVAAGCVLGPSAHLRPGSELAEGVRIGNFVEVKNSKLGTGTKADHLSYIGDADIGERVTFACGAITVNYDGRRKSRTVVGDGCFVGCNSNLIAPVTLAADSYVAAGSTITREVPSEALAVGRARQRNIDGWRRRFFAKSDEG
ncbi:MAG: bifunctional UDP-N-acetylglucosamine diphosphorylase/glucosamine-1-phosphate N-acetyltransferase GlmU [Myxococcota bacterium]